MKTFTVVLTEQDISIIGKALALGPYHEVVKTIDSINAQLNTPIKEEASNA